jgi:hypothetical protein
MNFENIIFEFRLQITRSQCKMTTMMWPITMEAVALGMMEEADGMAEADLILAEDSMEAVEIGEGEM